MSKHKLISDRLFKVRIPYLATFSPEELEEGNHVGIDTIDGKNDDDNLGTMATVWIKIPKMIEVHSNGFPIKLVDSSKLEEIYDILDNYIQGNTAKSDRKFSKRRVSDEDMEEVEKFAEEVFGYNKKAILKTMLSPTAGFSLGSAFMQRQPVTNVMDDEPGVTYVTNTMSNIDISEIKRVRTGSRYAKQHVDTFLNELEQG